MRSQTNLVRRGAVYYFRARVPADLIAALGKREIIESLRTKDKRTAEGLVRARAAELDREFAALRSGRANGERHAITDAQIDAIIARALSTRLGADEAARIAGIDQDTHAMRLRWLDELERGGKDAISRGDLSGLRAQADDWLRAHGFDLAHDSDDYRRFAYAFAKAQAKATQQVQARERGEAVDTPPMPTASVQQASATMDDLADYWKRQKNPRPKTWIEAQSIVRRFADTNGHLAPGAVTRRHIVAFRDALVQQGREPGTVKKLLGLLSGMFQVAVEDEQFGLETNPVRDVKVRGEVGEAKVRVAFSVDDLKALFAAPVFTQGERPRGGAGEAAFWLPLIGLFTGARLNEIGQLRVEDVRTEGRVHFIHFTNEGEGMQLKRGGKSRKRIPVHAELARLGFLKYVQEARERGDTRLFPELKADAGGHLTGLWSRWFNRYLDNTVGINDPGKDFHSLRHTFKHHARAAGIPKDQHDALTGHSNRDVSDHYGSSEGYPLRQLADAMKRLRYARLDLSKVKRAGK